MLMYECLSLNHPFSRNKRDHARELILNGWRPSLTEQVTIRSLLSISKATRYPPALKILDRVRSRRPYSTSNNLLNCKEIRYLIISRNYHLQH